MLADFPPISAETGVWLHAAACRILTPVALGTGERDAVHAWIGRERARHRLTAAAVHHVQHPGGSPRLQGDLGEPVRGQWGLRRGFEDNGVAECQRRCHLPRRQHQRRIPGLIADTTPAGGYST